MGWISVRIIFENFLSNQTNHFFYPFMRPPFKASLKSIKRTLRKTRLLPFPYISRFYLYPLFATYFENRPHSIHLTGGEQPHTNGAHLLYDVISGRSLDFPDRHRVSAGAQLWIEGSLSITPRASFLRDNFHSALSFRPLHSGRIRRHRLYIVITAGARWKEDGF